MSAPMKISPWTFGTTFFCSPQLYILTGNRGQRFTLSRDELLTLPEFVLLSLFPNGLLPDGHMNAYHDGDVYSVDVSSPTSRATSAPSPPRLVTSVAPASLDALYSLLSNPGVYLS